MAQAWGTQTWGAQTSGAQTWGAQAWPDRLLDEPIGIWEYGQAFGSDGSLFAGAIPNRDELAAWLAQIPLGRWWKNVEEAAFSLSAPTRIALGLLLAAAGSYLIVRSYQRLMQPTQGDLARRVARAAVEKSDPADAFAPAPGDEPVSGTRTVRGREADIKATHPQVPEQAAFPRPAAGPKAFLTADQFNDGHAPWAVPLGHDLVRIGRHQENDIRLEDKTVHRYHALLHRSPDGDFLIRDLSGEAGNGVYVNGARIEQAALRSGDLVELGSVRLRFQQQRPS